VAGMYAAGLAWLHRLGSIPAAGRFLDPPPPAGPPAGITAGQQVTGRLR
jgi:hypothetical protein